jgi:ribosomal protein L12E/L44/L45/RPP1/RPP2
MSTPAIGLKVQLDGVKSGVDKLKGARDEVRQIQKEIAQAAKDGQNVEKQFERLKKAQDEVSRQKMAMKGGSPSGLAGGGGSFSSGRGGMGSYEFNRGRIAQNTGGGGLSSFGYEDAKRGVRGLGLVAQAIGASGLISDFLGKDKKEDPSDDRYVAMKQEARSYADGKKKNINTVRNVARLTGNPIFIAAAEIGGALGDAAVNDELESAEKAIGTQHIRDILKTANVGTPEEKIRGIVAKYDGDDEKFEKDLASAMAAQAKAYAMAATGNLDEANALIAKSNTNFQTTRMGAAEMYINNERARAFNANYTAMFDKRAAPRTGDKE